MHLILDSSAAVSALVSREAAKQLGRHQLSAPPLLWSEVHSVLRAARWRGELDDADVDAAMSTFDRLAVTRRRPRALYREAYRIAVELGWAKTYDAEFLALARLEQAQVLTTDRRMHHGAARTGLVITPAQL